MLALYPSSFPFVLDIAYAPMKSNQISLQRFSLHLPTCVAFPFFDIVSFQRKRVPRYRSDRRPLLKNLQLEIPHCRIFPRVENRPIFFHSRGYSACKSRYQMASDKNANDAACASKGSQNSDVTGCKRKVAEREIF